MSDNNNLSEKIIEVASTLRNNNPSRYGAKGFRPGDPGYVEGGWICNATQQYYQQTGKMPSQAAVKRRESGTLAHQLKADPNQDALYRDYRRQLQELKAKYHQTGLTVVKPRNPKRSNPRAPTQRKRLPPIILLLSRNINGATIKVMLFRFLQPHYSKSDYCC